MYCSFVKMTNILDIKIDALYKMAAVKLADHRVGWPAQAHLAGMAVRH